MSAVSRIHLALAAACAVVLAPAAFAQAIPAKLSQGQAQLPTSGLVIDLPAKPGVEYHITGSWALSNNGGTFDTRDVIDEIDPATGNVVTGNWVLAGYFDAGGCDATLASAALDAAWTRTASLWGQSWSVRGGVFTFTGSLGRRPAAVLCRETPDGPTLLLYHFLANQPETTPAATVMDSVGKSGPLASASASFSAMRTAPIFPTRRTDVRNRGNEPAARRVELAMSGLEVDLPPDGYLWLVDDGADSDFLNRLLPTFPELSLETVLAPGVDCVSLFGSLASDKRDDHRPTGLPPGWVDGPALLVEGETELTMCHSVGADALVVGVFQGPDQRDVSTLQPMLGALLAAAQDR